MPNWVLRKSLKELLLLCRVKNAVTVVCVLYGLLYMCPEVFVYNVHAILI